MTREKYMILQSVKYIVKNAQCKLHGFYLKCVFSTFSVKYIVENEGSQQSMLVTVIASYVKQLVLKNPCLQNNQQLLKKVLDNSTSKSLLQEYQNRLHASNSHMNVSITIHTRSQSRFCMFCRIFLNFKMFENNNKRKQLILSFSF